MDRTFEGLLLDASEKFLYYKMEDNMTAVLNLANVGRDSTLPQIFVQGERVDTTTIALDELVTSGCRADSDALRAPLAQSRSDGDAVAETPEFLPASVHGRNKDDFTRSTRKKKWISGSRPCDVKIPCWFLHKCKRRTPQLCTGIPLH